MMKSNGSIHMQDNESTTSTSDNLTQYQSMTPTTSGAATPNTLEQEHHHASDHDLLDEDYLHEHLPEYQPSAQSEAHNDANTKAQAPPHGDAQETPRDENSTFCDILPQRQAVWMDKVTKIKLSTLAAATLCDAGILTRKNLSS